MKARFLLPVLVAGLVGCATQPVGVSGDQATAFREQGVAVGQVSGAGAVQLKTKGQAIGGMVIGSVVGSAAASSPASATPQGMQQAMELGNMTNSVVQQTVTDIGQHIEQADTPALAMAATIAKAQGERTSAAYHVDIKQELWLLDYDSMFGSDNYRLHWTVTSKVRDGQGKVVATSRCQGDGEQKRALDEWKAEDYSKVKEVARTVGERCAKQLWGDIGLRG
ncbi:hypothetical protein SAMN04487785_115147 [Dyella jiangningensis]|uniref:hypothetical protein n=1 Tax=Dyella sp. AtDHG13 TaxID=1938897 RepID=UPI00088417EB|nr:hypothetical protein [Dyella sp. AtDHG13]PXV58496.1 hypothetical protein BDW41_1051 [Dyella sp. AtDHG13]SDL18086.1 hypothetical protein SAMN04487785_115147 [Dyella jiangningensis]